MAVHKAITIVVYAVSAELKRVFTFFRWCTGWDALLAAKVFTVDVVVAVIIDTIRALLLGLFLVAASHRDVAAVEAGKVFTVDVAIAIVIDAILARGIGVFTG